MKYLSITLIFSFISVQTLFGQNNSEKDLKDTFRSVDFGKNIKPGSTQITEGIINIVGYGQMFGMHLSADQGRFVYKRIKGDFDIIIQVEDISSSTKAFTEGGLMIRKDLNPEGLFVSNFVTNNNFSGECDQYTAMWRLKEGGSCEPYWKNANDIYGDRTIGNLGFGYAARGYNMTNTPERPFPFVWLRIMHLDDRYLIFKASGDENQYYFKWEKLAEVRVDLGEEPFVGFALSANHHHHTSQGRPGNPESMSNLKIKKVWGF